MTYTEYFIPNTSLHLGSLTYSHNNGHHDSSILHKKVHKVSLNSKRQAFAKASRLLYFNPDMCHFSTLTYKIKCFDNKKVYKDFKNFVQFERINNPNFKYIAVLEYHKDNSIHIHLISNKLQKNKKGNNRIVKNWTHGFSSSWTLQQMTYYHRKINKASKKFDALKYLFNYIKKSNDKIGGRWLLKSANLAKPIKRTDELDYRAVVSMLKWLASHGYKIETKYIGIAITSRAKVLLPIYIFAKPAVRLQTNSRR